MRNDVRLHLIFDGPPNAPHHLVLESNPQMQISKKDVDRLIKRIPYKSLDKKDLKEIFPGGFIEKDNFEGVARGVEAIEEARDLYEKKIPIRKWVKENPKSALSAAIKLWGYGPRIIY